MTQTLRERVLHMIYNDVKLWDRLWPFTDAYGEPGFLPPQGYDWSGFRDSSEAAIEAMAVVIGLVDKPIPNPPAVAERIRKQFAAADADYERRFAAGHRALMRETVPPYAVRKQLREATLAVGRKKTRKKETK